MLWLWHWCVSFPVSNLGFWQMESVKVYIHSSIFFNSMLLFNLLDILYPQAHVSYRVPTPQFCCSVLCQEILLLWARNGSLTKPFALKVEGLLGGAQRCNPSLCHLGQWIFTCMLQGTVCPESISHGNQRAKAAVMLLKAASHHSVGWDVARGHSQTWEFGSAPRFPYTVRALLSEGQKLFHRQQEACRQEVWRQAERGVWVQTLPCPSCCFPADTKGSWRTMSTLPHFKNLAWNNYSVSQFSTFNKNTGENVRPDQGGGTPSTQGSNC